jgi:hypothetical protein
VVKVIINGRDKEVMINKLQDIADNSFSSNLTSVITIVVKKAM